MSPPIVTWPSANTRGLDGSVCASELTPLWNAKAATAAKKNCAGLFRSTGRLHRYTHIHAAIPALIAMRNYNPCREAGLAGGTRAVRVDRGDNGRDARSCHESGGPPGRRAHSDRSDGG